MHYMAFASFLCSNICIHYSFPVFADQDSVQMLQRSSQVGEFYRMAPPSVFDMTKTLPGSYLDIMIYDEEADKLVHIEFEQALRACCIDPANEAAELEKVLGGTQKDAAGNDVTAIARLVASAKEHTDKLADATKKTAAEALRTEALFKTVDGIVAAVKAGVCLKLCITIARPFIEHHMLSAVAAVSGRDTGATLYGPADMQISANTSVKTIEGHFTWCAYLNFISN